LIGIRTARTLEDRELWLQMHRVAGYVAVLFGVVVMIAGNNRMAWKGAMVEVAASREVHWWLLVRPGTRLT
jgi:uncharacterized membrane protein